MAFNIGAAPKGILERALTGNIFVEKSLAFMNEGDKDSYNAYKHDIRNVLQPRSANPASSLTNTKEAQNFNRVLTVVESFQAFDPAEYHNYWKEYQPDGTFQWETLPSEVQKSLEELFLGTSAEAVEDALTNGNGTISITGLIPQLEAVTLTSLNGVSPTAAQLVANLHIATRIHGGSSDYAALTTANIFSKLELLIAGQTKEMRKRTGRKFMVSPKTGDILTAAQRLELEYKGVEIIEEGVLRYAGYDILINNSFPDNTIMFASMTGDMKSDAIQLGTSMSSDFNNVEVERVSNFGRQWGMCLTFALDIFVVRPEEVCFYTPTEIA